MDERTMGGIDGPRKDGLRNGGRVGGWTDGRTDGRTNDRMSRHLSPPATSRGSPCWPSGALLAQHVRLHLFGAVRCVLDAHRVQVRAVEAACPPQQEGG